ncbi:MAG: hypothetical protein ACRCTZ_13870 [Sarcina sp.]
MKFVDSRNDKFEYGEGDIITTKDSSYMVIMVDSKYSWLNLNTGYISTSKYKTVDDLMRGFNGTIHKNDRFKLILE